jgi:hypothetical protein
MKGKTGHYETIYITLLITLAENRGTLFFQYFYSLARFCSWRMKGKTGHYEAIYITLIISLAENRGTLFFYFFARFSLSF